MTSRLELSTEVQIVWDELASVSTAVTRLQERLLSVTKRYEDEAKNMRARINQLESNNREAIMASKWLREQNAEFEARLNNRKLERDIELGRAIDARDAAFRKLRNARKVIRDLLVDRTNGLSPDAVNSENISGAPAEIEAVTSDRHTHDIEEFEVVGDPGSESESNDTVRMNAPGIAESRPGSQQLPRTVEEEALGSKEETPNIVNTEFKGQIPSNREADGPRVLDPVSESSSLSVHPLVPPSQDVWQIHYSRPPRSTELAFGPISWNGLSDKLGLDEETVASLESLALATELSLRLQIANNLAFIYDPIILESPNATYIIDWGRRSVIESVGRYVTLARPADYMYHTFFFPVKQRGWYYVGGHTWTPRELWSVWPTLTGKSREDLANKLSTRTQGALQPHEIEGLLDEGKLTQVCIEISSMSHRNQSREFVTKMGYYPPGQAKEPV